MRHICGSFSRCYSPLQANLNNVPFLLLSPSPSATSNNFNFNCSQPLDTLVKKKKKNKKDTRLHNCPAAWAPSSRSSATTQTSRNCAIYNNKTIVHLYVQYVHNGISSGFWESKQCQKLKRSIKSWGESGTVQLSGLLAVHGWFVSCKDENTKVESNHCCLNIDNSILKFCDFLHYSATKLKWQHKGKWDLFLI